MKTTTFDKTKIDNMVEEINQSLLESGILGPSIAVNAIMSGNVKVKDAPMYWGGVISSLFAAVMLVALTFAAAGGIKYLGEISLVGVVLFSISSYIFGKLHKKAQNKSQS